MESPDGSYWDSPVIKDLFLSNWEHLFPEFITHLHFISVQEWIDRPHVRPRVRKILQRTYDKRKLNIRKRDFKRDTFIKVEFLNKSKPFPDRTVSGPEQQKMLELCIGPYIYSMAKAWKSCNGFVLYTSGSTAEDISDFIYEQCSRIGCQFEDLYFILDDLSRQDACETVVVLKFLEEVIYSAMGCPTEIIHLLRKRWNVYGVTMNSKIVYKRQGGRNTGDQDTSFGNSVINYLLSIYALWVCTGGWDWTDIPFFLVVQGDDSLICLREHVQIDVTLWSKTKEKLGFIVKCFTQTPHIYEVDYISKYFWPVNKTEHPLGWLLGVKPGRVLAKVGWSKVVQDNTHWRGVAMGMVQYSYVPFVNEYFTHLMHVTDNCEAIAENKPYSLKVTGNYQYNERTFDHFVAIYGFYPHLDLFTDELQKATLLPFHINFEQVDMMRQQDLS